MATGIQDCISEASGTHGFTGHALRQRRHRRAPLALGDTINGKALNVVKGSAEVRSPSPRSRRRVGPDHHDGLGQHERRHRRGPGRGHGAGRRGLLLARQHRPSEYLRQGAGRIDCVGSVCTYAEEMTNFANWYAYYRTRMQMMKSASGRAFHPDQRHLPRRLHHHQAVLGSGLGQQRPGGLGRYLKIADFDKNHKDDWYKKFYEQKTGGGTPLREALSRVGRLYAGQFDGINDGIPKQDDPVQVSCQPNFAILSSDGYWNGNNGDQVDNSGMTEQDHNNTGRTRCAPTASTTAARAPS